MGCLKSLAEGFLVALGIIWIISIIALFRGGDVWLGVAYLLILLLPVSNLGYFKYKNMGCHETVDGFSKWRSILFALQGVALAFWSYDLLTTFYAIDITGLAYELNPLGWPLGLLGAFVFYGPALVFSYMLLFKFKDNTSLYGVIPLTVLTMAMSFMNLFAGAQNFQVFVQTANLATNVRFELMTLIVASNLLIPLTLTRKLACIKLRNRTI